MSNQQTQETTTTSTSSAVVGGVQPLMQIWAVSINRKISREEFATCLNLVDPKARVKAEKFANRNDAFRYVLSKLLPSVVVWREHPVLPPTQWCHNVTKNGKDYMGCADSTQVLGYDTARGDSLVTIAFAYGHKPQVVNIGVDIMQLIVPRGISARKFADSFAHKLTTNEELVLDTKLKDEVILRRLCILLTIKTAYIKALGQPAGFDYSRIDCNIPEESVMVDGKPLLGWEFRLFKANLGVLRHGFLLEETYQCSSALYRGGKTTKFVWEENVNEMKNWLRFINADAIIADLPKPPPGTNTSSGTTAGTTMTSSTSGPPASTSSNAGSGSGKFAISA
ncbi:hypothetical protein Clacol_003470 [Clathrus columnatus]|uniref:holo-[acyl-carrier-protein] synthase n=1 Tax=Clathrus columnatus TaxID=1419009 RepID=A0AAV5A7Q6_9AGAM|nr:hypothetical protein Clacol_003470 [Clathrus columnatus]